LNYYPFTAYIDPGTGSMLLTVILGVVTTMIFVVRGLLIKFKYKLSGSGAGDYSKDKVDFVFFSDHKRYWNVFKPVCDEMERRHIPCSYWTMSADDPALSETYEYVSREFIGEGSKGFARLNTMRAAICMATTPGLDVLQWKRSREVDWYVHIYHSAGDNLGYRMFGLDYYDAVLETGDVQTKGIRLLEKLRGLPAKELTITGCTYLDAMQKRLEQMKPAAHERTTVLLAPSWGASSILNRYGADFIRQLIQTGYKIIIRPHPQSKTAEKELLDTLMAEFPENENLEWNYENDNYRVLSESDLMISDYSGVIFDYTFIFDKPIMYADVSMDRAPYDSAWVDYTPWTLDVLSKLGKKLEPSDFDHMKDVIDEVLESDIYREGRETARAEAWAHRKEAAVRTCDYLTEKLQQIKGDSE